MKNKRIYRLLSATPPKAAQETRSFNAENGSDAETFAAAMFISACRGEVSWGSRDQDNSKIDLILSYEHPWFSQEKVIVLSQVKSGASYGEIIEDGVSIKPRAVESCLRTSHSICLIWVDRKVSKIFWAYLLPGARKGARSYGRHHELTPAIAFDLARCMATPSRGPKGGTGITIQEYPSEKLTQRRRHAKEQYRHVNEVVAPTLGNIEFTRLGWRHMFRSSRSKRYKALSLNLIPLLPKILIRFPSDQAIIATNYWNYGLYSHRSVEHLLKFSGVAIQDDGGKRRVATVVVRLVEEIRYPKDWAGRAMLSQNVSRRVVLRSAYYKNQIEGSK